MMKNCPNCGAPFTGEVNCKYCGTFLLEEDEYEEVTLYADNVAYYTVRRIKNTADYLMGGEHNA